MEKRLDGKVIVISGGNVFMDGTPAEVFADPDKLVSQGLDVPKATAIAMKLRECGITLEGPVCTHEQLLAALSSYRRMPAC